MLWAVVSALLAAAEAANILVFMPFPGHSHHQVLNPLVRELAARGHNVTSVTPFTLENPPQSYKEVHVPNYALALRHHIGLDNEEDFVKNPLNSISILVLREMGLFFQEKIFTDDAFKQFLESDSQFDLILTESMFLQESFVALRHRFNAIAVEVQTFPNSHWSNWLLGIPYDTSYIGDLSVASSDRMSFLERLENTVLSLATRAVWYWYYMPRYQAQADRYLRYPGWETRPPLLELVSSTSIVLINTHPALNYPYPMAAHAKQVGGLNLQPSKPLPQDLEAAINASLDGVILFTLGSHIQVSSTLGPDLQKVFSRVFGKQLQTVFWKWETDFPNVPDNVIVRKWFPQSDILAHKKCRLLITQGGSISVSEAIRSGVPMIGIPILGDQFKNVNRFRVFEYGIQLDHGNLTETSLSWALNEILTNTMYKENVEKQRAVLMDEPASALETAVFWVEYALRHGGAAHLRPAVTGLAWYQQALLDVYLALGLLTLGPLYLLYLLAASLLGRLRKNDSAKKKTS